jgi:hypothetical protein
VSNQGKSSRVSPVSKSGKNGIGKGTPGPGRPKGMPNKTTASVKAAIIEAFEKRGGVPALVRWAEDDPTEFYKLWGRIAPTEVEVSGPQGGPVEMTVRFVAVGQ